MSRSSHALVVLVTGATGPAGRAVTRDLLAAGQQVVAVGRDDGSLTDLRAELASDSLSTRVADLTDPIAVEGLVRAVREQYGALDGLIHLVGGWRGGAGFTDNSDADWDFLRVNLIDTLRHLTLAVHDDLVDSVCGRVAIISAKAAAAPTAGNANYATAKAAAEAWMFALADSLRRKQSGRKVGDSEVPPAQTSAATVGVITAIGDKPSFTSADQIGRWCADLFTGDAAELNGARILLPTNASAT